MPILVAVHEPLVRLGGNFDCPDAAWIIRADRDTHGPEVFARISVYHDPGQNQYKYRTRPGHATHVVLLYRSCIEEKVKSRTCPRHLLNRWPRSESTNCSASAPWPSTPVSP